MNFKNLSSLFFIVGKKKKPHYQYYTIKIFKKVSYDIADNGKMPEPELSPNLRQSVYTHKWQIASVKYSYLHTKDYYKWLPLNKKEAEDLVEELEKTGEAEYTFPAVHKQLAA